MKKLWFYNSKFVYYDVNAVRILLLNRVFPEQWFRCAAIVIAFLLSIEMPAASQPKLYVKEFLESKPSLKRLETRLLDSTNISTTHDVFLITSESETIRVRIRIPEAKNKTFPVAFLVVGIETGRRVVGMIEGYDSVVVVGIDYPYSGLFDFSGWNAIRTSLELRKMAFKTIPQMFLCFDWLSTLPQVDTNDITVIAVSFGVFTAIPAAVIDKRVDRLVVVQAGGDMYQILRANVERLEFVLPTWLAAWSGEIIFAPFEPNRYVGSFSPRPLLIVSGETDSFFPPSSVQSLYDHANHPKEWIQHASGHVMPTERELIFELTKIVGKRLYE